MRLRTVLVNLACLAGLSSFNCFGQSLPVDPPVVPELQIFVCPVDGEYKTLTLLEGQRALFTGKLMTLDLATCLATKIYSFQVRSKEGLHFLDSQWRVYYNFNMELKNIEIGYLTEAKQLCLDTVSAITMEESNWWESSPFWFSIGLLIGVVTVTSIYIGVDSL